MNFAPITSVPNYIRKAGESRGLGAMSSVHGKGRALKVPVPASGTWGCFPCLSMRTRGSNRSQPFHGVRGREVQRPASVRIHNGKRRAPRPKPLRCGSGYGSRPYPKPLAPTIPGTQRFATGRLGHRKR